MFAVFDGDFKLAVFVHDVDRSEVKAMCFGRCEVVFCGVARAGVGGITFDDGAV